MKKGLLHRNVQLYLNKEFDWKAARETAGGDPLTDTDKVFRASVVNEYNNRVQRINDATTVEEVNTVPVNF